MEHPSLRERQCVGEYLTAIIDAVAILILSTLMHLSITTVIPAATARRLSATPEQMAVIAAVLGALAVTGGLFGSLTYDTPSGPSIVVAALGLFVISIVVPVERIWRRRQQVEAR